jgi:hypothetical protein
VPARGTRRTRTVGLAAREPLPGHAAAVHPHCVGQARRERAVALLELAQALRRVFPPQGPSPPAPPHLSHGPRRGGPCARPARTPGEPARRTDGRGVRTPTRGAKLGIDATVVESNIRQPNDAGLLADCVRVFTRLVRTLGELVPGADAGFHDRTRSTKR